VVLFGPAAGFDLRPPCPRGTPRNDPEWAAATPPGEETYAV